MLFGKRKDEETYQPTDYEIRRFIEEKTEYPLSDQTEKEILPLVEVIVTLIDSLKVRQLHELLVKQKCSLAVKSELPTVSELIEELKLDRGKIFAMKSLLEVLGNLLKTLPNDRLSEVDKFDEFTARKELIKNHKSLDTEKEEEE